MLRTKQLGQVLRRCFSAQAQLTQEGQSSVSELKNGLRVVACNSNATGTKIALLVNTGSRDDAVSELGLTHCLQASAGLTSTKNTSFLTSQLLAALGADLEVTVGRESIIYNIGCFETAASELVLDVLTPAVLGPKFLWWELRDSVVQRMKYQKAYAENDPFYVLMENAHKASFRGNFGNTVLSPDQMIGKHSADMLTSRFNLTFSPNNIILAGAGISQAALEEIGNNIEGFSTIPEETMKRQPATFVSSEIHSDRVGDLSYAALTYPGVALNDKDAVTLSVLQEVLGSQSNVKGGSGVSHGLLNKAVAKSTEKPFSTSAFSINYSDCGLFGVTVTAPNENLCELVTLVASELGTISRDGIAKEAVDGAKRKLKLQILSNAESYAAVSDLAYQASILGNTISPQQMSALVDKITHDEVTSAAKRLICGKKSLTTLGKMCDGPYLQDL